MKSKNIPVACIILSLMNLSSFFITLQLSAWSAMGVEAAGMMLRVQLQETSTLDLYYQENTSVHEEDELAAILLAQWNDYHQAGVRGGVVQVGILGRYFYSGSHDHCLLCCLASETDEWVSEGTGGHLPDTTEIQHG